MTNIRNWLGDHAFAAYVVLTLTISWAVAIPLALVAQDIWVVHLPFGLHYLTSLGPITAALIVTAAVTGKPGLANLLARMTRWRIGWRWWLVAAGSPIGLFAVAAVVARVAEGS